MWKTVRKVQEYVEKYKMIRSGEVLVAGISGGADSVCLFYILKELQKILDFKIVAVHVNHNLRGEEAARDEAFVRELCEREKVPFVSVHRDVGTLAKEAGISLEEAGRNARYESFEEVCRAEKGDKIVLAHHQDDLAETMIHHLARGTGAAGLCSLKPVSGNRIRPLLCLDRAEIETYLSDEHREWKTDSTNLEDHYTRNKIRHHVVSYLCREVNPQSVSHMAQTAEELGEIEELLHAIAEKKTADYVRREENSSLILEGLSRESKVLQRRIFLEELKRTADARRDFTRVHVENVQALWTKQVGKQVVLPYGVLACRQYEGIRIEKPPICDKEKKTAGKHADQKRKLCIPGETRAEGYVISCEIIPHNFTGIEEKKYTKWLDYDKIKNSLEFRHRCPGDRICVHPSGGSKKLKDYLIDRKIPQSERDELCMIADGQDILWVIGDRISQKYKVSDTTRQILHIKIRGGTIHE